jgi:hypothetical protein
LQARPVFDLHAHPPNDDCQHPQDSTVAGQLILTLNVLQGSLGVQVGEECMLAMCMRYEWRLERCCDGIVHLLSTQKQRCEQVLDIGMSLL